MPSIAPYKSMHDVSQIENGFESGLKNDQRYNALRNLDDISDSSTELGDWEMEGGLKPQGSGRRARWRHWGRYRWLLDTTLLLTIVGLLVEKRLTHHRGHPYEFAGDITGFAPTCMCKSQPRGNRCSPRKFHNKSLLFVPIRSSRR